MMNLEELVGKKTFARLKKANIATPEKLSTLSAEEMMKIAGIGPKTAMKIVKSFGRVANEAKINKEYRDLKIRTRFKKIITRGKETIKDPTKVIDSLEDKRKKAILWKNLLANVYNFGKAPGERVATDNYVPMSRTLDPFDLEIAEMQKDYVMEVRVVQDGEKISIAYTRYNMAINKVDWETTENFLGYLTSQDALKRTMQDISNNHDRFRNISNKGTFIIILDRKGDNLVSALQTKYAKEVSEDLTIILNSEKDYYDWEIIFKYVNNKGFNTFVKRAETYWAFFAYRDYLKDGGESKFEDFLAEVNFDFFGETNETKRVHINVNKNPRVYFGIIRSMPGLYDYLSKDYKKDPDTLFEFEMIDDWQGFIDVAREQPIAYKNTTIRAEIFAFVDYVFKTDYIIYYKDAANPIIFASKTMPDIGIVIY